MNFLEERIAKDGIVKEGNVLKVDSFLNHQMDIALFEQMGEEFARRFAGKPINKILTIEASGIGIASVVARSFNCCPVVFAKKKKALNMSEAYIEKEKSYTRDEYYDVSVAREFINKDDQILIVDDFLANGEALNSLVGICRQANATILGAAVVVCKIYQPGLKRIENMGIHVECLAKVKSLENNTIEFE